MPTPTPTAVTEPEPAASRNAVPTPPRGSPSASVGVLVIFLGLVVGTLLLQTAADLRGGDGIRALDVFRQKPTAANLRAYERVLEDASVLAHVARPGYQFAQFAWLRDGGEKALLGHDGWLFYKPGFDAMIARGTPLVRTTNDPVAAIVAFRDQLAARGVQLLVVPAPNKESIYPDRLTRRVPAGATVVSATTRDVLGRLASAGVECLDLFRVFATARQNPAESGAPELYLTQDSHWSPAGVALAAKAAARRLTELGWAEPGGTVYRERPAPVARWGDVLRMLQSPALERRTTPETVPCVQVLQPGNAAPYHDDANASILVLGDSFLRIYAQDEPGAAGFIAHLAKALRQPLVSLVNDGGASTLVRQELHRRPALLRNKRVVIWEFVERDLRLGTEGWQPVPLPPPLAAEARPLPSRWSERTREPWNGETRVRHRPPSSKGSGAGSPQPQERAWTTTLNETDSGSADPFGRQPGTRGPRRRAQPRAIRDPGTTPGLS